MQKVTILVSIVKAISAWLHGEGSQHFRTYTYPRIKSLTRKFVNLGLYERVEHLWRIVDDTFYQGAVEDTVQTPAELAAAERLAEQQEQAEGSSTGLLPRFEDIRDSLIIFQSIEQERTYRCVTFTVNNMLRTAMIQKGLRPPLEVTAIDPLYIATKVGPGKTGTNSSYIMEYLGREGYPMPSWNPHMTDHNKELAALESNKNVPNAHKFVAKVTTGKFRYSTNWNEMLELDRTLPANWIMQVSVNFSESLRWFGQRMPYVRKIGDKYNLTRTGGHSIHGVRRSFSTWENGEAGFAIIDSAYRSTEDGFRFVTKKLVDLGIIKVRFVEFNLDEEVVTPEPTPAPQPTNPPSTISDHEILLAGDIKYGDNNGNVFALQKYLISAGFAIPDGPTTYFGRQTQVALKNWQDSHFGPKYDGTLWGPISRQKYIELNNLG